MTDQRTSGATATACIIEGCTREVRRHRTMCDAHQKRHERGQDMTKPLRRPRGSGTTRKEEAAKAEVARIINEFDPTLEKRRRKALADPKRSPQRHAPPWKVFGQDSWARPEQKRSFLGGKFNVENYNKLVFSSEGESIEFIDLLEEKLQYWVGEGTLDREVTVAGRTFHYGEPVLVLEGMTFDRDTNCDEGHPIPAGSLVITVGRLNCSKTPYCETHAKERGYFYDDEVPMVFVIGDLTIVPNVDQRALALETAQAEAREAEALAGQSNGHVHSATLVEVTP